jgi:inhibitor of cysteine peptidase
MPLRLVVCRVEKGAMTEYQLTQADNGKLIEVRTGNDIAIILKENPTTGYRWDIDEMSNEYIDQKPSHYVQPKDIHVGGGGSITMTFTMKKPGTTRLALKLWRSWSKDSPPSERFAITIRIHD